MNTERCGGAPVLADGCCEDASYKGEFLEADKLLTSSGFID